MIVFENFKQTFYGPIKKDHVLILSNVDVDAVCATQILLDMFAADDVAYTLVPVDGWNALGEALREHGDQARSIILFNCGATKALVSYLRPGMTLYIIDSRRPFNLENVFYDDNIRLIVTRNEWEQLNIPDVHAVDISDSSSTDDSGSEDDEEEEELARSQSSDRVETSRSSDKENEEEDADDDDGGDPEQPAGSGINRKRVRDVADEVERREVKRRRRIERENIRANVLWAYYENNWYAPSTATVMLEVANAVGRTTVEMMWSAVVGLSSQLVEYLISDKCYTSICYRLGPFIRKFMPKGSDVVRGDDILRIKFDEELSLPFYTHWSLYTSMINHDYFFCQTRLWQQNGISILKTLLAELEITLDESHRIYKSLSIERKRDIFQRIYNELRDNLATFVAHIGYSERYNSCDFGRAMAGRVSFGIIDNESAYDRFLGGQRILQEFMTAGGDMEHLSKAVEAYKNSLVKLVNLVSMSITQCLIVAEGPFYLLCLPQEEEVRILHCRHFLNVFIYYVRRAFSVASRSKNRKNRPIFLAVPMSGENAGWFLITGIMPINTEYIDFNQKSFLARAMDKAVKNFVRDGVRRDSFDPSLVMIRSDQKARFFDGLQATLEIE